jgi:hypothetical protein
MSRLREIIAKWIVINIAWRISPKAVYVLCLDVSRLYDESFEMKEDTDEQLGPNGKK